MACRVLYTPGTKNVDKVFAQNGEESIVFNDLTNFLKGDKQKAYKEYVKTRTPKFKEWFGDSKFVDDNGEPLVFYHGSDILPEYFLSNTPRGKAIAKLVKSDIKAKYDTRYKKLNVKIEEIRDAFDTTAREKTNAVNEILKEKKRLEKEEAKEIRNIDANVFSADGIFFSRDPRMVTAYGKEITVAYLRGENVQESILSDETSWDPDIEWNMIADSKRQGKDSIIFKDIADKAPTDYERELFSDFGQSREELLERRKKGLLRHDDMIGDTQIKRILPSFRHDQYVVFESDQIKSGINNKWKFGKDASNIYLQQEQYSVFSELLNIAEKMGKDPLINRFADVNSTIRESATTRATARVYDFTNTARKWTLPVVYEYVVKVATLLEGIQSDPATLVHDKIEEKLEYYEKVRDTLRRDYSFLMPKTKFKAKYDSMPNIGIQQLIDRYGTSKESLQQEVAQPKRPKDKEIEAAVKQFLSQIGVDVRIVNEITDRDGKPIKAIAKADMLKKVIEVVNDKADVSTLPEEASHFFISLLKNAGSPLYKSMYNLAPTFEIYEKVMEEYSSNPMYQNEDGTPNIEKLTEEAMGKILGEYFILDATLPDNPKPELYGDFNFPRMENWWGRVKAFFKRIMGMWNDPYRRAAYEMLSVEIKEYYKGVELGSEDAFLQQEAPEEATEGATKDTENTQDGIVNKILELQKGITKEMLKVEDVPGLEMDLVPDGEELIERYTYTDPVTKEKTVFTNRPTDKTSLKLIKKLGKEAYVKMNEGNELLAEGGTALHGSTQKLLEFYGSKSKFGEVVPTHENGIIKNTKEAFIGLDFDARAKSIAPNNLSKGVHKVLKQIEAQQIAINETTGNKNGKFKLLTEAMLMDPVSNTAGTVDVLVVFSDGSTAIYDWKFNSPKRRFTSGIGTATKITLDPLEIKIDGYNTQISTYKEMLTKGYGITNFRQTRIIPAFVNYYSKKISEGKYEKTKIIQVIHIGADQNEFMRQIAVAGELSSLPDLNKLIINIRRRRDEKKNDLQSARGDKATALRGEIDKFDKQINSILVEQNVTVVLEDVAENIKTINEQLHINDPKDSKYLSDSELERYLKDFAVYNELGSYLVGYQAKLEKKDKEKFKKLSKGIAAAQALVTNSTAAVRNKLHERLTHDSNLDNRGIGEIEGKDPITGAVIIKTEAPKKLGLIDRNARPMSENPNPLVRSAHKLIVESYTKTEQRQRGVDAKLEEMKTAAENWGKKNGLSLSQVFDKIINPETGNLFTEVNPEFYEEIKERQESGRPEDIAWLKENLQIKKDARNDYIKNLRKITEYAKQQYPDITEIKDGEKVIVRSRVKERNAYINAWESKYDVWSKKDSNAWLTNKWRWMLEVTPEAKESNKSENWKFLEANPPLLQFVKDYRGIVEDLSTRYGDYIPANFVGWFRDGFVEQLFNDGVGAGFKGIGDNLRRTIAIVQEDQTLGVVGSDGKLIAQIPTAGLLPLKDSKGNITPALKSRDLLKSLSALSLSINNHIHMSELEGTMLSLQDFLLHQMEETLTDRRGNIVKKDGRAETNATSAETLAYFDSMVKLHIYGQGLQSDDMIGPGNISLNKTVKAMMSLMSMKTLAFPVIPGIAARIAGEAFMRSEGVKGIHYDTSGLNKAEGAMLSNPRHFKAFGQFFDMYQQGSSWKRHLSLSMKSANKHLNLPALYAPLRIADENMEETITWAMGYKHGINEKGELKRLTQLPEGSKNLHELTTFDKESGSFIIKGMTQNAYLDFRARVKAVARKSKGQMDNQDALGFDTTLIGQGLGQFKGWMPGLVLSHLDTKHYNHVLDVIEEGRFTGSLSQLSNAWNKETQITENMLNVLSKGKDALLQFAFLQKYQGDPALRERLVKEGKWSESQEKEYRERRETLRLEMERFKDNSTDPKIKGMTDIDEFMRMRARSVNQTVAEVRWILGSFMAITLLGGLGPEDDKWVKRHKGTRILMKALSKARLEMGFMLNPMDAIMMMKSPFPVIQLLVDAQKAINNFYQESADAFLGIDNKRDNSPFGYYTLPYLIPGWNQARSIFEPYKQDKINKYESIR